MVVIMVEIFCELQVTLRVLLERKKRCAHVFFGHHVRKSKICQNSVNIFLKWGGNGRKVELGSGYTCRGIDMCYKFGNNCCAVLVKRREWKGVRWGRSTRERKRKTTIEEGMREAKRKVENAPACVGSV
jgi:hypothetical protein